MLEAKVNSSSKGRNSSLTKGRSDKADYSRAGPSGEYEKEDAGLIKERVTYPSVRCKICEKISAIIQVNTLSPHSFAAGITLQLEGKKAKQLGFFSREEGIDSVVGKGA